MGPWILWLVRSCLLRLREGLGSYDTLLYTHCPMDSLPEAFHLYAAPALRHLLWLKTCAMHNLWHVCGKLLVQVPCPSLACFHNATHGRVFAWGPDSAHELSLSESALPPKRKAVLATSAHFQMLNAG